MIDITTTITPIKREYPNGFLTQKWVGSVTLKGGIDESILHYPLVGESPRITKVGKSGIIAKSCIPG